MSSIGFDQPSASTLNARYLAVRDLFTNKAYTEAKRSAMALLADVQTSQPSFKHLERCVYNVLRDIQQAVSRNASAARA